MSASKTHKASQRGLACIGCGTCRTVCPFLERYGTPDRILARNPRVVFECTNCGACDTVCPKRLSPSQALFRKKSELLASGAASDAVRTAHRTALSYAAWGGRFPFRRYRRAGTVFWPGCGLAGAGPELVRGLRRLLARVLKCDVGLVLDCCHDPAFEIGDVPAAVAAAQRIAGRLKKSGIREVITGCANCSKIFSLYLPDVKMRHVIELLAPGSLSPISTAGGEAFLLHHPCPSFRFDALRTSAAALVAGGREKADEIARPACCGLGGDLGSLSPGMSRAFAGRIVEAAGGRPVVTYCMACRAAFEGAGLDAYHVFEMATGLARRRRTVSALHKWLRRLGLALVG